MGDLRFLLARGQEGVEAEAGVEAEEIGGGVRGGAGFKKGELIAGGLHGFPQFASAVIEGAVVLDVRIGQTVKAAAKVLGEAFGDAEFFDLRVRLPFCVFDNGETVKGGTDTRHFGGFNGAALRFRDVIPNGDGDFLRTSRQGEWVTDGAVRSKTGLEAVRGGAGFGEGDRIDLVDGHGLPAGEHEGLGGGVAVLEGEGAVGVGGGVHGLPGAAGAVEGFTDEAGGVGDGLGLVLGGDDLRERDHASPCWEGEGLPPVFLAVAQGGRVHLRVEIPHVFRGDALHSRGKCGIFRRENA